jgi:uncharacterized repeat protein (TIGR03803 family)
MLGKQQSRGSLRRNQSLAAAAVFGLVMLLTSTVLLTQSASAQTFKSLFTFNRASNGTNPYAGLVMDRAGNLYGTTAFCVTGCGGTVYRLSNQPSGWSMTTLYSFAAGLDGAQPLDAVVFGSDGGIYGTTGLGGGYACGGYGCGTVFRLTPSPIACTTSSCSWAETVLHRFTGAPDGNDPYNSVIFDVSGAMYLTTRTGGQYDVGAVVKLIPSNGWTESVIYDFQLSGMNDYWPESGLILDSTGSFYGTATWGGGHSVGTVYKLVPSTHGWVQDTLYSFGCQSDGAIPTATLTFDRSGNLYGTSNACSGWGGAVFMMTPSNGGWSFSVLHSFVGDASPLSSVIMDAAGNLYGTTCVGGTSGMGNVFRLTPSESGWIYTSLHDFTGQDGTCPMGGVIMDASGKLYGTTLEGGANNGFGTVFEITP